MKNFLRLVGEPRRIAASKVGAASGRTSVGRNFGGRALVNLILIGTRFGEQHGLSGDDNDGSLLTFSGANSNNTTANVNTLTSRGVGTL